MSKKAGYKSTWYADWFGRDYISVYGHRDNKDAASLVKLISQHINLNTGQHLLDIGCGNARHSVRLAKPGASVTGIDLSRILLNEADELRGASSNPGLVRGDMRDLPFKNRFDAVFNLFTSFGYFPTDEENVRVVREMARVLRPGGLFFLDYLNADFVRQNLIPESIKSVDGMQVRETRWIEGNRVNKEIQIKSKSGQRTFHESVRLYVLDELKTMFAKSGIIIQKVYGGYRGETHSDSTPRLIIIASKT